LAAFESHPHQNTKRQKLISTETRTLPFDLA
jgi:hypothetical protein